jgi:hypothetical protein
MSKVCSTEIRFPVVAGVFLFSLVGIATGYRLDDRRFGVRVPVGSRIFFSPRRPDRLWGPRNLLSNGYGGGGSFPGRKAAPPTSSEVKKI